MLEYWNYGFWGSGMMDLENQNETNHIDCILNRRVFLGAKAEIEFLTSIIINVDSTFFVE